MAAEAGHAASRVYVDQSGDLHLNGASLFDSNEIDLATGMAITGTTTSAADSLAIPITARYVAKTTGADAEALTLADGSPGQRLTIYLATDGGGDGTLTPATSTGWATCVFADAGDSLTVEYVDDTAGWIVVGCLGLTAQPTITA